MEHLPELIYILRIRPATPHSQWQAILKDPKTDRRRTFTTALELARHLVALSEVGARGWGKSSLSLEEKSL